jgi:hypothetical protein
MKNIVFIIVLILFVSCKEVDANLEGITLCFENPQPINDSELNKIPNKFHGIFRNKDSSIVTINNYYIVKKRDNKFKIANSELDSLNNDFNVRENKIISKIGGEIFEYRKLKDSIEIIDKSNIDTLFRFNQNHKAKRINGYLILNQKGDDYWTIRILNIKDNILIFNYLNADEDLKRMDSITKIKSVMIDSSTYIVKLYRNEFSKILKLNEFGYKQEFSRVQ